MHIKNIIKINKNIILRLCRIFRYLTNNLSKGFLAFFPRSLVVYGYMNIVYMKFVRKAMRYLPYVLSLDSESLSEIPI